MKGSYIRHSWISASLPTLDERSCGPISSPSRSFGIDLNSRTVYWRQIIFFGEQWRKEWVLRMHPCLFLKGSWCLFSWQPSVTSTWPVHCRCFVVEPPLPCVWQAHQRLFTLAWFFFLKGSGFPAKQTNKQINKEKISRPISSWTLLNLSLFWIFNTSKSKFAAPALSLLQC